MHTDWILWLVLLLCLFFSALFSSSETALSMVNRIRVKHEAEQGDKRASRVLALYERYNRSLTGILIGNNIVNIAASAIGTVIFTSYFGAAGPGIATAVLTILVLVFGEVMPKTFAKDHAQKVTSRLSGFLSFIIFIFTPIIFLFDQLKNLMEKFTKGEKAPTVTEQELKVIIHEIEGQGVLEDRESDLVRSALDFDETTAEEVMTPRVDIVCIEKDAKAEEIKELFLKYHYSRLPVYEKEVDNIIGILHERDFLRAYMQGETCNVEEQMQTALFVPQQIKISELLKRMQAAKMHMSIVVDQYGGVEGIITLEDIVEQLVGDIYDEYDVIRQEIQKIAPDIYRVRADLGVKEMFEKIGFHPANFESESNTVGGWALENFEKLPETGDRFVFQNMIVTVVQKEGNRICWLTVQLPHSNQPSKSSMS